MLGRALVSRFEEVGHTVSAPVRAALDLAHDPDVDALPSADVVVNAAAWTDVDGAETQEGEAFALNATGASRLARACRRRGSRLVHISTDYVFDGKGTTPYPEDAPLAPLSAYGRSKAAGEWAVLAEDPRTAVVRTAWLYGPGPKSFVSTIAKMAHEGRTVSVVDDQYGQPTTTRDVARFVGQLVDVGTSSGVWHATSEGETTWFGLARAIFAELGLDPERVTRTTSADFPRPASRPTYSVLGHSRTLTGGLELLPHWRQALSETLPQVMAWESAPSTTGPSGP